MVVTRAAVTLDTPSTSMDTLAMTTTSAAQLLPMAVSTPVSTLLGPSHVYATLDTD